MAATILYHPNYSEPDTSVDRLRDRLADALATEAEWHLHLGPELAARYWSAFGDLELAWRRAQAKQGAHGRPELAAGRQRLQTALERLSRDTLAGESAQRFIAQFRYLVRRAHPELSDEYSQAWPHILNAFRDGDTHALDRLAEQIGRRPPPVAADDGERGRLAGTLAAVERRLEDLRGVFPFRLQSALGDKDWIAAQRAHLARRLAACAPAAGKAPLGCSVLAEVS